jgi:surfactin synthase thioesterase subunit
MNNDLPILFTVPYAGGHSMVYRNLKTLLQDKVQVETLEPPGRGKRANEPLLTDLHEISADMFEIVESVTIGRPFSVLGHSMGALIAYLITKMAVKKDSGSVIHLFCSGHIAPIVPKIEPGESPRYKSSTVEFWKYIESLGALPPELKAHEELMSYFEPIVRADIQALESYQYEKPDQPLDVPLTMFYGTTDAETPIHKILPWQSETTRPVRFIPQSGGHFGFFDNLNFVANYIHDSVSG